MTLVKTLIICVLTLQASILQAANAPFLKSLNTNDEYNALSKSSDGLIKSKIVKFFIDNTDASPDLFFINGNFVDTNGSVPESAQLHYDFGKRYAKVKLGVEEFNNATYFTNDLAAKKYIAGTLQTYTIGEGADKTAFYGIQFYPQDQISERTLLFAVQAVKKST